MNRIVIKLNKGGKYNSSKFPRCNLAALQAKGPKGCPGGVEDRYRHRRRLGALPVVEDPVNGKLTLFNGAKVGGKDAVLVYVFPDLGPTFVSVCKISKKVQGSFDYTLDCSIPPIKTLPSAPDASVVDDEDQDAEEDHQEGQEEVLADRRAEEVHRHVEGRGAVLLRRPARR